MILRCNYTSTVSLCLSLSMVRMHGNELRLEKIGATY